MLFHDRLHVRTAALMLKRLGEDGHMLSVFTYSLFSIFHIPELKQESFENLLNIVSSSGISQNIEMWLSCLQLLRRSWDEIEFRFDMAGQLCNELNQKNSKTHYNVQSWPVSISQLGMIDCYKCRVKVVLYNFCNPVFPW